jgi:hypothetical protein
MPLELHLTSQRLEDLRAEIETLTADKSSTSDSECGVVSYGSCIGGFVVYSRATVDENVLLEKVQDFNELEQFMVDEYHIVCLFDDEPIPSGAISENGVCVAGSR